MSATEKPRRGRRIVRRLAVTGALVGLPLMAITGTALADPAHHDDGDHAQHHDWDHNGGDRHHDWNDNDGNNDGNNDPGDWQPPAPDPGQLPQIPQLPQVPQLPQLPGGLNFGSS
ncbi:hypothetical protein [Rhodococcus sp. NPDC127528]|uniref:hypothetical protein n=1 Tax=unclassified Rhodococcus (in: high G+C Gram-positive bacteria) TaxID=192944 RepID=UPI003645351D